MFRTMLVVTACAAMLGGCAAPPPAWVQSEGVPLRDEAFNYRPGLVAVSQEDLFRLGPDLQRVVQQAGFEARSPQQRLNHLLSVVFGADSKRFAYAAGHSTTAAETWRARRGDCLSLTVLTYSVARALRMQAQMQEVHAPVLFDRRGEFDFVNQHVNVLFRRAHQAIGERQEPRDVVIDFEPDYGSSRAGKALDENGVYARYLNNVATEHLANGRRDLAYAYYRAAMEADPGYAATYGNLALLYRRAALPVEAERLLQRALALNADSEVPLHALHQMMLEQGREADARHYEAMLQARRERDPYHWIALGARHLEAGEFRRAIVALEQARDMTGNFREVHTLLALAYWRAGEPGRANEELTLLAALGTPDAGLSKLRKKFGVQQLQ